MSIKEKEEEALSGIGPRRLQRELYRSRAPELRRRRAIIALSLLGAGSMAAVSLLQTGILTHLPDPPLRSFDSDKVNLSKVAYQLGVPDGTLALVGFAANVPLAAMGGLGRARRRPWIPLLAAAKAAFEAAAASWYFYQMPAREKAWCGYCVVGTLASVGVLALTLPEAKQAVSSLRRG